MKTKFFYPNKQGKIEFTEKELKQLLDEIYKEGYDDGKKSIYTYTYTTPYYYPSWTTTYSTSTADDGKITYTTSTGKSNTIKTKPGSSTNLDTQCINNTTNTEYTVKFDNN